MLAILGGIFLGWSLGANAAGNVIGPAVTSRMLKFGTAAFLASMFVLLGALIEGHGGIETLKGLTLLNPKQALVCSVAAALTITIMTALKLPISTAQAAVGAIVGIGLLNHQLNLQGLGKVVACWFATPLGGLVMAAIVYKAIAAVYNRLSINLFQTDLFLRIGLILAGSYGAYTLGANNVANVTAVFVGAGQLNIFWATFLGGLSIDFGISTFSKRVMKTVGYSLVRLDPFSSLVVVLAEAITVHIFTILGVPVSTAQAVIGAVLGVGIIKGINTVHRRTLVHVLVGWFVTPALACVLAVLIAFLAQLHYIPGW